MEIKNLTKVYKTEYELVKALNDMTLTFPQRGLVFIVGVSGSGKSTLMNMLSGVDKPTSGEVIVNGKSLFKEASKQLFGYRNSYVGLIFQDYNLIEDINVYENIKLPLKFLGYEDFSIIDEVIKKVDIEDIKYSKVTEISSGQMQRVAIARALVKDSAMILADEPTGNLDSKNTAVVMNLLKEISKDRLVIVITHDDDAARFYGDRIIAIEDGTILEDTLQNEEINVYDASLEKRADFIKPKISFMQQIKFTLGFIKNSLARSIAIFIMLILIPLMGNVLCGYAFFDIATSYKMYQETYKSEYVELAGEYSGYTTYYKSEDWDEFCEKYIDLYPTEDIAFLYSIYSPLVDEELDVEVSEFYQPVVTNLIVNNNERNLDIIGDFPLGEDEIAITDYIQKSYEYYTGETISIGDVFNIGGIDYDIVGIVRTSYQDFIGVDTSDSLKFLAFRENLNIYNACYASSIGYQNIHKNSKYFVEEITYTMMPNGTTILTPTKKTAYVTVRNGQYGVPGFKYGDYTSLGSLSDKYGALSQDFWEGFLEHSSSDLSTIKSVTFVCSSTEKYNISSYIGYVYDRGSLDIYGTSGEIVLQSSQYERYIKRQGDLESKFLISTSTSLYKQIVEEENVVNPSFSYASATWIRAESSKYVMYEFLITLIIIMVVFAYIINSMTLNIEKKKIGIKYSFGITKGAIIVPYLIETFFYIFTGLVISLLLVNFAFPAVMTSLVYTTEQEILEYAFFYISSSSIAIWDLVIYLIMSASLLLMILMICRKSPIEIIKDL